MIRMTLRLFGLALIACTTTGLAGCSQIAALAPVGGNGLAEVRFGAIDVLQQKGVEILAAPVCSQTDADGAVTCAGTTGDGRDIAVTSNVGADATLVIVVGGETIFSGSLSDVLDEAARG